MLFDISKDPVYANNQKHVSYWECDAKRFNANMLVTSFKSKREKLCKDWDKVKKYIYIFSST